MLFHLLLFELCTQVWVQYCFGPCYIRPTWYGIYRSVHSQIFSSWMNCCILEFSASQNSSSQPPGHKFQRGRLKYQESEKGWNSPMTQKSLSSSYIAPSCFKAKFLDHVFDLRIQAAFLRTYPEYCNQVVNFCFLTGYNRFSNLFVSLKASAAAAMVISLRTWSSHTAWIHIAPYTGII